MVVSWSFSGDWRSECQGPRALGVQPARRDLEHTDQSGSEGHWLGKIALYSGSEGERLTTPARRDPGRPCRSVLKDRSSSRYRVKFYLTFYFVLEYSQLIKL